MTGKHPLTPEEIVIGIEKLQELTLLMYQEHELLLNREYDNIKANKQKVNQAFAWFQGFCNALLASDITVISAELQQKLFISYEGFMEILTKYRTELEIILAFNNEMLMIVKEAVATQEKKARKYNKQGKQATTIKDVAPRTVSAKI